jgi:hypothetical protein
MLLKRGLQFYLVLILFAVYLINGLVAIPCNSVTYDEMDHWSYGKRILKLQPQKIYPYDDGTDMPIYGLNALPRAVEQLINPSLSKTDGGFSDIMHGRYVTLLICLLIGVYIYKWSKELFGKWAGVFSLFLFVFCPNLNAHAALLSSDSYTALSGLITFYYFCKFVIHSGWKNFILFNVAFSIALLTKYTLLHFLPVFGLLSLFILLYRRSLLKNWKQNFVRLAVFSVLVLTIINIAFLFNGCGQKLSAYNFRSSSFQALQKIPVINNIPLPLPVPYVEGFDVGYHMTELGAGHPLVGGKNYLFGKFSTEGIWYYYIAVILFKTPLPYLIIFLLLAGICLSNRKKWSIQSSEFILLFGLFYFLIYFSFFMRVNGGIRHIIFLYPILYVLAGRIALVQWKQNYRRIATAIFIIWSLASFYFFFPNLISYTNELILDKKRAYKIMADSNLDYGQGNFSIESYLQKHKDVQLADTVAKTGKFVLGVNDYVDIYGSGKYGWLKNFEPVAHINHCYLLFNVTTVAVDKNMNERD